MEKENEKAEEKEIINDSKQENIVEENEINKENKEVEIEEEKKEDIEIKEEKKEDIEIKEEIEKVEEKPKEEAKEIKSEEKEQPKEKKKSRKLIIIIPILIVILLFISTIFAIVNMNNEKIIDGVFIEQVNIYGLTQDEANKIVNEKISKITEVTASYREYNENIVLEDIDVIINAKKALQEAVNLGKTGNILIDNYQILLANLFEEHYELEITINEEKFDELVKNIQAEIPNGVKQYSYDIKDDKLIITNGKAGNAIDAEELKNKIIENIKEQFNGNEDKIEIPVGYSEPEKIDLEKIYNKIYKEAKDAYIVEEPFELHKEENGIDFKISMQEAKQLLTEEKETYTIPLKITKPKVAVKDLGEKLFKQTLSKYTTIYDAGNINRSHNIALAAKTINGTILLPGETFSYNGILGNTNKAKGYKVGTAYVGGKVVESYGGGICQVSSTLYNAVLYANLGIVERHNHSYIVNYVPAGRDATVAYGGKDFKFKNTRSYPIKIVASAKNGIVSVTIKGIKEEKEYEVVLTSTVLSSTPCKIVYEENSSLAEGVEKVMQKGYTGKKSIAYKILKYNGKTISKTVLSKDTYKPMNRIIQVGTKKTTTQTNAQPTTTTQPTVPTTQTSIPTTVTNTIN